MRRLLCWLGFHSWRRVTFNDEFTGYRDQPGRFCARCCASLHDGE